MSDAIDARKRWTSVAAAILIVFYLATSVTIASRRPLWFDEIVTALFARLPGFAAIWAAGPKVDAWGMPAPYYMLAHAFVMWGGRVEIAARLPSALAVAAGLWLTFDCSRRVTDGLHGLIAIAALSCSFLPYYGFEARSYGMVFMLAALSIRVWTHPGRVQRHRSAIFFLVFLTGTLMHPYFVLCLVPYAALNLLEWRRNWRPDGRVIAGALGIVCAGGVLAIHVIAAHSRRASFPGEHPSFAALVGVFPDVFPGALFLLAVVTLWIVVNGAARPAGDQPTGDQPAGDQPMSDVERLGWLFLLTPPAAYVLARVATNAFAPRYLIGMLPGVGVALACVLWRHFRQAPCIAIGVLTLLACVGAARQISTARHPESIDPYGQQTQMRQVLAAENKAAADGKQFILISGAMLYMEAGYYSKHPERYRYLEPENGGASIPAGFARYYPLTVWNTDDVRQHAGQTAVVFPKRELEDRFRKAGMALVPAFAEPIPVGYLR